MSPLRNTAPAPTQRRHIARVVTALGSAVAAGLTALTVACADGPTAPTPSTPAAGAAPTALGPLRVTETTTAPLEMPLQVQALLRTTPLAKPVVVTKTIPSGGGSIGVPGTDFQLQIPKGAFAGASMTFTITAYAGSAVAYDFQPHGTVFLKPLKAVQQLGHTNLGGIKLPAGFYPMWAGAYFADSTQVDPTTGLAAVDQLMATGVNIGGATASWDIPHFSGYLMSTGRR